MDFQDPDEVRRWATQQWGSVDLGDQRRNERAAILGEKLAARPDGSLPEQMRSWGELKAAYRLLAQEEVTFERLSTPHWLLTRQGASTREGSVVLFIQDGSDLDFSTQRSKKGLGPLGNKEAYGLGLLLHSCLATLPEGGELLGLAHQKVWARQKEQVYRANETRAQRYRRRTESDVWAETLEAIGPVPEHTTWVSVGDRGSDVFSYLRRAQALGWECLLRVGQDRRIETGQEEAGEIGHLFELLRSLAGRTETEVEVRGRAGKPKRTASLKVDWTRVKIMPPRNRPEERDAEPIEGWCVRAWEEEEREDALEWMLFCTLPVIDADSALEKVGWYAKRWLVEEYHKSLKTGCRMEKRQLRSAAGIKRLLGFLGIVAVRVLQLREVSRNTPEVPAIEAVPELMVKLVAGRLEISESMSFGEFWRNVARVGGFIGRKSDGDPGWQTLWKGWLRVLEMYWAAQFALEQSPQSSQITRREKCG
jgi:Transposase DNA-binding/Transposase DDE domain